MSSIRSHVIARYMQSIAKRRCATIVQSETVVKLDHTFVQRTPCLVKCRLLDLSLVLLSVDCLRLLACKAPRELPYFE